MSYDISREDVLNALNKGSASNDRDTLGAVTVTCDQCRSLLSAVLSRAITGAIAAYMLSGFPAPFILMLSNILNLTADTVREQIEAVDKTEEAILTWMCQKLGPCQ